jgi:hypothetical protein
LCFGWGGLGLDSNNALAYDDLLDKDDDVSEAIISSESGYDILTCLPPSVLDPSLDDFKKIVWRSHKLREKYDFIILDPPAGGHPLSLLAAGLSETIMLFSRPDAASTASSFCLLKSLHAENIADRTGTVYSLVDSVEQAATLRRRFDLLSWRFLGLKLWDFGFVQRLDRGFDQGAEIGSRWENSDDLITHLNLDVITSLQNETLFEGSGSIFPGAAKVGR